MLLARKIEMAQQRSKPIVIYSAVMRCFVIATSVTIVICQSHQPANTRTSKGMEGSGLFHRTKQLTDLREFTNSDDCNDDVDQINEPEVLKKREGLTNPDFLIGGNVDGRDSFVDGNQDRYYNIISTDENQNHIGDVLSYYDERESHAEQIVDSTFGETANIEGGSALKSRVRRNVGGEIAKAGWGKFRTVTNDSNEDPSCRYRCGEMRLTPCSCDHACYVFKTCCEDVAIECPSLEDEARIFMGDDLVDAHDLVTCDLETQNFIVEKCPWPKTPITTLGSLTNADFMATVNAMAVVHDNVTGLVFRNRSIYNCYRNDSGESLYPWTVAFSLRENVSLRKHVYRPENMLAAIDPKRAKFYPQSLAVESRRCREVIDTCKNSLVHLDPGRQCGKFISHYQIKGTKPTFSNHHPVYGNRHCFYCNMNETVGSHGITLDSFGRGNSFGMSVLMDYTKSDSGLKISLSVRTYGYTKGWTCNIPNSPLPVETNNDHFSGSLPQCNAVNCGSMKSDVLFKGKCVREGFHILTLRHPPKENFKNRQILKLAKFISCYLEKANWKLASEYVNLYINDVTTFTTLHGYENIIELISLARGLFEIGNRDEYYLIKLNYLYQPLGISVRTIRDGYIEAAEDAVRHWFLQNDYVDEDGDDGSLLVYRTKDDDEHFYENKQVKGERNDGDDGNDDDDDNDDEQETGKQGPSESEHPKDVLMGFFGLSVNIGQIITIRSSTSPIVRLMSTGVDYNGLAQCHDENGFEPPGGRGMGAGTGVAATHYHNTPMWVMALVVVWVGSGRGISFSLVVMVVVMMVVMRKVVVIS